MTVERLEGRPILTDAKSDNGRLRAGRIQNLIIGAQRSRASIIRAAFSLLPRPWQEYLKDWLGHPGQYARFVMNQEISRRLTMLNREDLSALEISGKTYREAGWAEYRSTEYPQFDLCAVTSIERDYDVVLCEQVLEHVPDPIAAVQTLFKLVRPGGHLIVNTPFLIRIHEYPADYWRFTPQGLRRLLEHAGFVVEEVGSWGNRSAVRANFDSWAVMRRWRALVNEENLPVVVWAFAGRE